jgi:hypothetical protein
MGFCAKNGGSLHFILCTLLYLFCTHENLKAEETSGMAAVHVETGVERIGDILSLAEGELSKRQLRASNYKATVFMVNSNVVIVEFQDPDISDTQLGSSPRLPSLEVYVDTLKMKVIRSCFSR